MNRLKRFLKEYGLYPFRRRAFLVAALFAGVIIAAAGFVTVVALSGNLPSVEQIDARQISQSTRIYDRTGEHLLYEISAGKKRAVVPYDEIPQSMKDATLAIEDKDFYTEPAFNWKGILRAVVANLQHGEIVQGGSTITQQLARNAFLTTEQTVSRKLRELLLAVQLSRHYSKDKIFWLYLNEIPYGATIYGVGTASEAYFNKPVSELTIAESAILASIPKAPPYYSPWGSHLDKLFDRQRLVLKRMLELKKISQAEYDKALAEKITFQPQNNGIKAPHFVLALQDHLIEKYGEDIVRTGGLQVISTLDFNMQEAAEKAVREGAARNEQLYKGKNAALVAEDPKTGQILALVGSRNYFDINHGGNFNVATQGLRQPGSALKPFAYLTLFEKGFVPQSVLFDVPTEFVPNNPKCPEIPEFSDSKDPASPCFHPQNFEGNFVGPISIRTALAESRNIPAVKTLYLAGMQDVLNTLKDFGISSLTDPRRYGLSLVLGGGEVKLIDMVKAYSTLAQEGARHEQTLVLEVRDANGQVLEQYKDEWTKVADAHYVNMINNILSDTHARAGLLSSSLNLTIFPGHEVALKTGTTNDYRDAWAMGYTPGLAVGVWAGNNDNAAMQRSGSSILAAIPIWSAFMKEALKSVTPQPFVAPDYTTPSKTILSGSYYGPDGQIHNELYFLRRDDLAGDYPSFPANDPQFSNWESAVQTWLRGNPGVISPPGGVLPQPNQAPQITILSPKPGSFIQDGVAVEAVILSSPNISQIKIYWNGALIQQYAGDLGGSYILRYELRPQNTQPQNLLEVEAVNTNGQANRVGVVSFK